VYQDNVLACKIRIGRGLRSGGGYQTSGNDE
jgi:hypothetical protein